MVTEVTEKRIMSHRQVNAEFDGKWVVLDERDFSPPGGQGYLVAYGDGTPQDRDALDEIIFDRYKGQALLLKGYIPKEDIIYGIYQC
jgi:uncharacterized circularly permuted ATP-grasp superfamily protein